MTKSKIRFGVITEIPKDNDGNYACGNLLINPEASKITVGANILVDPQEYDKELFAEAMCTRVEKTTIDLTKKQMLMCNVPVFRLGEIMIIDTTNDRTIPEGRKPSKWDVECEYFDTIEKAIKRAKEVYP